MSDETVEPEDSERPVPALPERTAHEGGGSGLVRYDPLRAYMAEVQRHPVLSREEEHALAVQ